MLNYILPLNSIILSISQNKTLNIVLSNLDTLTENTLAYFINSNLCQNAKLALSQNNIHIYILDLDRDFDSELFNKAELFKQHIIGIYINENHSKADKRTILVKKPLNVSELKDAINKAYNYIFESTSTQQLLASKSKTIPEKKIKHKDQTHRNLYNAIDADNIEDDIHLRYKAQRYVGNNKDINPELDELKPIYIKTKNYFYSHLVNAIKMAKSNSSNTIIKTSLGNIVYYYKENKLSHNIHENKLKLLQTTPLISPANIAFTQQAITQMGSSLDATAFLWDTSIRTSKGRLPELTSLTNPVMMTTWPNFSQFIIFRHSIAIAAAWSKQRISLIETAKMLNIPQRYVFSLFSAMNALGYANIIEIRNNDSNRDTIRVNQQAAPSKLFSKILNHIFKRK